MFPDEPNNLTSSTSSTYEKLDRNNVKKASNFVKHMKANKTLTHLDLSHNLIGSQVRTCTKQQWIRGVYMKILGAV